MGKWKPQRCTGPVVEPLEERQLFSADLPGAPLIAALQPVAVEQLVDDPAAGTQGTDTTTQSDHRPLELVFVDASVPDYQSLIQGLDDGQRRLQVVVIGADQDGLAVIGQALSGQRDLGAIHIFSHGAAGEIRLGSETVDATTLLNRSGAISAWGEALDDQADILLYGCDVAADANGREFVNLLAQLTGADVAASDDLTGSAVRGGDWVLEYRQGFVESDIAISQPTQLSWNGLLDIESGLVGHWTLDANATDASGNGNDGVLTGNAAIDNSAATNQVGPGKLALDGSGDYVELASQAASFSSLTQGTISGWIKTSDTTNTQTVFSVSDKGDPISYSTLGIYQGSLFFDIAESKNYKVQVVADKTVIADGNWHHVAVTVDSNGNSLYIDGTKVAVADLNYWNGDETVSNFLSTVKNIDAVEIGVTGESNKFVWDFNGLLDDIRVYDRALNAGEIAQLHDFRKPPGDIDLSQTTQVAITNPGFESQALADDANVGDTVTGWTVGTANGTVGVWNPSPNWYPDEAPEGNNVAYIDSSAGGNTLSQILGETFQAGRSYTLSAWVGDELPAGSSSGWEMRLYAGTQLLGKVTNADYDPADGQFVKATLHLDADTLAAYSANYGDALKIELYNIDSGGSTNVHFDDVQLEYTAIGVDQNAANGTVVADVASVTDPNAGDTFTFSLSNDAGGRFAIDANTGIVTVANGALLDYATNASHDITIRVTDQTGLSYDETFTIQVRQPLASLPAAQSVDEDNSLVFSAANGNAITVNASGLSGGTPQVSLSVDNGTLTLSQTTGLTFSSGDGTADAGMTFSGSVADINAALEGLSFTPSADYNGPVSLQMTTWEDGALVGSYTFDDTANLGADSGPGTADNGVVTGAVSASDPVHGQLAAFNAANGDRIAISGLYGQPANVTLAAWIDFNGIDPGDVISLGDAVVLRAGDWGAGADALTGFFYDGSTWNETVVATTLSGDGWHHVAYVFDDVNNRQVLYLDGTEVASTAFSASISYTSPATAGGTLGNSTIGHHADPDESQFYFNGRIDDARIYDRALSAAEIAAIKNNPARVETDTLSITVNAVNDAPVLDTAGNMVLDTIAIDDTTNVGNTINQIVASAGGNRITDVDTGALEGIAVIAVDDTNGQWQYSLDGSSWTAFGAVSGDAARLLPADNTARIRFVPNAGWSGTVSDGITFHAWDQTTGTAGGTADINGTDTVLDQFNTANSYAGNDGTASWSGDWIELGESDGPGAGWVRADGSPAALQIGASDQIITGYGASRAVDLGGTTSATLTFDYWKSAFDSVNQVGAGVRLEISADGGTNWTLLHNYAMEAALPDTATPASFDISAYANSNTVIRFIGDGDVDGKFNVDNIQIAYNYPVNVGGTTAFSTAATTAGIMVGYTSSTALSDTASGDEDTVISGNVLSNDVLVPPADPTRGTTLNYTAANDGDATWNDDNGTAGFDWAIGNFGTDVTYTSSPASAYPGITAAYQFTGVGGATLPSLQDLPGNPSNASASFEIWFRPNTIAGSQVLFETGGNTVGTSVYLNGSSLVFATHDNGVAPDEVSIDLGTLVADPTAEFIQFVGVIDMDNNQIELFVNGQSQGTAILNGTDWSGSNGAGLGQANGNITAGSGNFDGDIALFRFYEQALDSTRVLSNFNAITVAPALRVTSVEGNAAAVGNQITLASGALLTVNADGSYVYTPASDWNGTDAFTYVANDGVQDTNSATVTVTVNPVNDAPVITTPGPAVSYTENDPPVILAPTATVGDIDSANFDGGTLTITKVGSSSPSDVIGVRNEGTGAGQIGLSGTDITYGGTLIGSISNTIPFTVTFNANADQAAVQALARNITFSFNTEIVADFTRTLRFTLTDGDGGTSAGADVTVNAISVNDAPVNTVPGTQTVPEETQTAISGISIDDPDGFATDVFTTQLGVTNGALNVALSGSVTIVAGANDSASLTLNGTLQDLNTVLGTLKYTGNTNVTGIAADTLTIVTDDNGNNGGGGAQTDTDTIQIDITNINDAPVLVMDASEAGALAYTENDPATAVSSTVAITDVDNTTIASAVVRITGNYQAGEDLLAFTDTASITGSWDAATGTLTLTGTDTLANYQAALRSVTYQNSSENPVTLSRTVSFTVNDGTDASNSVTRDLAITAVNDAPVVATNTGMTVAEGSTGTVITTAMLNEGDPDDAGTGLTYTLTTDVAHGSLKVNGVVIGVGGTFTQADIDAGLVTYDHDGSQTSSDSFAFALADGGEDGAAAATGTFAITVTNVNDAPVNTVPGAQSVDEDTSLAIGGLSVADDDDNLSTVQLAVANGTLNVTLAGAASISAGANGSADLTLSGSLADINTTLASLTYQGNANFNGPDTLTILSTDSSGATDSDTVAITVKAVNDAPVLSGIEGTALAYTENDPATAVSSTVAITDVDNTTIASAVVRITGNYQAGEDLLAFTDTASITGSWDAATGTLTLTGSDTLANYQAALRSVTYQNSSENPVTLTRTVSFTVNDGTDASNSVTRDLAITAVNDAPVVAVNAGLGLNEGATATIDAAVLSTTDPDNTAAQLAYTVTAGPTNGQLELTTNPGVSVTGFTQDDIDNNRLVYVHDGSETTSESFAFTVSDGQGASTSGTFAISVTLVNENAPVIAAGQSFTVSELAANGTTLGTVSASDIDTGTTLSGWTITGGNSDGIFAIDAATGALSVVDNTNLDFDTTPAYTLSLTVSDGLNTSAVQTVSVVITDQATRITAGQTFSLSENTPIGTLVGHVATTGDQPKSFAINAGNTGGAFAIDNSGAITVAGALNYETLNSYTLTITASDGTTPVSEVVTIGLTDVNEAPVGAISDNDATANTVAENSAIGTAVGITALASDPDGTDTVSYSLSDDAGGRFAIDSISGVITVAGALDYETATSHSVTVLATSTDGSTSSQVFSIAISDVNEAPTAADGTVATAEDTPYTLAASDFGFSDVDGDTLAGITITTLPTAGQLQLGGVAVSSGQAITRADIDAGLLRFVPAANANGNGYASFGFTVSDGSLDSAAHTLTLDVTPVNDPGTFGGNTSGSGAEDTVITGILSFTDAADGASTPNFTVSTDATSGTASIDSVTGAWTYTPNADFNGADSFTVTVTDDGGNSQTQVVNLTISAVADIANDTDTTAEDTPVTTHVLSNDSFEGTPLVTAVTQGANGSVSIVDAAAGTVQYTPNANFNGSDSYTYTVTSGGVTETATVTVTVAPVNDPGTFGGDTSGSGAEDTVITGTLTFSDASDGASNPNFTVSASAANGTATIDSVTGAWTYTPNANFNGADSFTVTVTDDAGNSETQVIGLSVTPVNDAPTTSPVTLAAIAEDSGPRLITQAELLANVGDVDGDALTATGLTITAGNGTLVDNGDDTWTYTPAANDDTAVGFGYGITDGSLVAAGSASLDITPVNDAPVITSDGGGATASLSLAENQAAVTTVTASDPDSTPTFRIIGGADQTLFGIDATTGALTFNISPDFENPADANGDNVYEVTVQASDGALSDTQAITIRISDVNEAAVGTISDGDATPDTVAENSATGTPVGIVALASDPDGTDTVGYSLSDDAGGRFAIDGNTGVITVAGALDYETATGHSVTVLATSSDGSTSSRVFTIAVSDVNEAPVGAVSDNDATANTVAENAAVGDGVGITVSATDPDGSDTVSYSLSDDAGGRFAIDSNTGVITVAGALNYQAASSHDITVLATSSDGSSSSRTFTITITPAPDAGEVGPPPGPIPPNPPAPDPLPGGGVLPPQPGEGDTGGGASATEDAPSTAPESATGHANRPTEILTSTDMSETTPDAQFASSTRAPLQSAALFGRIYLHLLETAGVELLPIDDIGDISAPEPAGQQAVFEALNRLHEELADSGHEIQELDTLTLAAGGAAISLTAGAILWVLRTGSLAASLLSVMPLWAQIDPLPVLSAGKKLLETDFDLDDTGMPDPRNKVEDLVAGDDPTDRRGD